jgi:hypothetical protein
MIAQHLFARALQALFGTGHDWKAQGGAALMIKPDSVDAMTKGTSRIPPGVWKEIADLLQHRADELPTLRTQALEQFEASKGKVVFTIGSGPGTINGARSVGPQPGPVRWTEDDVTEFQRSLDNLTRRIELPRGKVTVIDGRLIHMEVPGTPDQGAMEILRQWFQVNERARIILLASKRSGGQMIPILQGPTQQ